VRSIVRTASRPAPSRPSEIAVVITIAIDIVRLRRSPAKASRQTNII
jgi:hypothetical protein